MNISDIKTKEDAGRFIIRTLETLENPKATENDLIKAICNYEAICEVIKNDTKEEFKRP